MPRPNVLLLVADELRADALGYAGSPVARTPNLDALAAGAARFGRAYTPAPICVPARQSIACGQHPFTCGVERFADDLPPFSMTFARRLGQFGYRAVAAGKLHHHGPDQMQGWETRLGTAGPVAPWNLPGRDAAAWASLPPAEAGVGKWPIAKEVARAGVGRGPLADEDGLAVAGALALLDAHFADPYFDRPGDRRPLLLMVSLNAPHYPWLADEGRFTHFLNRVEPFDEPPSTDHPFLGRRFAVRPGDRADGGDGGDGGGTRRDLRRATAAYHGMVARADAQFGQVLDRLRHLGQDPDDWVVAFTSDHGEMLGQHGCWEKQKFYDASARVPLFVRPPGGAGHAGGAGQGGIDVGRNVSLVDLFPTLCELCGVPVPPAAECVGGRPLDGRSLVPLVEGRAGDWDAAHPDDEAVSWFADGGGRNLLVARGDLKYQWYDRDDCRGTPHEEVLFDLAADPAERADYSRDPAYAGAMAGFRARRDALLGRA